MTRDNRTISETRYETSEGKEITMRSDVGAPEDESHNQVPPEEADHHNIVTSVDIAESGNRTVMDNQHVDF